eukprot:288402_1
MQKRKSRGVFRSTFSLLKGSNIRTLLNNLMERMRDFADADYCILFVIKRQLEEMVAIARAVGPNTVMHVPQGYIKNTQAAHPDIILPMRTETVAVRVARTGISESIANALTDHRFNANVDEFIASATAHTRALLCAPVKQTFAPSLSSSQAVGTLVGIKHSFRKRSTPSSDVLGVVVCARTKPEHFTERDEAELEEFHDLIAVAILRHEIVQEKSESIQRNMESISSLLSNLEKQPGEQPAETYGLLWTHWRTRNVQRRYNLSHDSSETIRTLSLSCRLWSTFNTTTVGW